MLRPLGDRVLIKPHTAPDQTDSGLWLSEHKKPEQSGVVVAVGRPVHPRKRQAEEHAMWLEESLGFTLSRGFDVGPTADLLRTLVRRKPCVKVGDDVVFSWQVGQTITVDGEEFLLMREDDLLCVLEGDA